ncbi:P-loop containing nucleoside triphosphate hydrolase protein [Mycena galericulata]|nr:P-loop containing nucleoside triphosphate hydrolase protein [Mycena galericulata]
MDSFSSGHHITIQGGTGGSGGQGGDLGGAGGNAEGPRFNVMVHGNLVNNFTMPPVNVDYQDDKIDPEARNWSSDPAMAKDHKPCPLPVSSFTGRRDILQKMHHYFDHDQGSVQHIFVLYGLGGSGKSQLAFKFLHDSQDVHCFSEIFYIDATNEQTLELNLKSITTAEVGNSAEASLHWLAGKQDKWLLFFDNADDTKLDLSKYFPRCTTGNILVTTRNREVCLLTRNDEAVSKVSDMEAEDAKDLLLQLADQGRSDEQEKLAMVIVKELQCFPLAVSHAGGYIRVHSKLSGYLKLYQNHRDKLLQRAEIQGQDRYGLAVYATWNLSYDKLSLAARTLLQICSILHHEGISEQIFEKAATSQEDLDDSNLQKEVTQLLTEVGKQDAGNNAEALEVVVMEKSKSMLGEEHPDTLMSMANLAATYRNLGRWIDAQALEVLVMEKRKCLLGEEHPDTLTSMANLAATYWNLGRWNNAEALEEVVMEKRKCLLGEEHPDTLLSMANLAATYRDLGRWNDAVTLEVVVMEKSICLLGEEHPHTLTSVANLAATYRNLGRWNDAEVLDVVVIEKSKSVLGEEHPDMLTCITNFSAMYRHSADHFGTR